MAPLSRYDTVATPAPAPAHLIRPSRDSHVEQRSAACAECTHGACGGEGGGGTDVGVRANVHGLRRPLLLLSRPLPLSLSLLTPTLARGQRGGGEGGARTAPETSTGPKWSQKSL
eukprot:633327-Rhodomonas_salina.1